LDTRHRKIDTGNTGPKSHKDRYLTLVSCTQFCPYLSFCVLCPLLPVSICLCLVPNDGRVYLSVSCVQCCPCLSFCVLCPMLPVSIFLCLDPNVARVYLSVSCIQCYPCLSFCVLCPMLPVSIFLCLLAIVENRHGQQWTKYTER
jgi:hypothetical protein